MRRPWQPVPVLGFGTKRPRQHQAAATALPLVQIEGSEFDPLYSANYVPSSCTAPAPPRNPGQPVIAKIARRGLGFAMTTEDTRGVTIIAEPSARQHVLVSFFLCWLVGFVVVLVVAGNNRLTYLWVTGGVILVAAAIGGCFRGWRIGLRIDASGVTIRNFFRTHRIGWREVDRFADGAVLSLGGGNDLYEAYWVLRVALRDERQTAAGGLGRSPGRHGRRRAVTARGTLGEFAHPETLAAIKRAAERYGIPAELTGNPRLRDGFWTRLRDRRGRQVTS